MADCNLTDKLAEASISTGKFRRRLSDRLNLFVPAGDNRTDEEKTEDIVDPWNVISSNAAGIDYDKLICMN